MNTILKMLLKEIMYVYEEVSDIKTLKDLYRVSDTDKFLELLAANSDDNDAYSIAELLQIANEVYQEKRVTV